MLHNGRAEVRRCGGRSLWRAGMGVGGEGKGGGRSVPGMHYLSQGFHSLCLSIVESGEAEGV